MLAVYGVLGVACGYVDLTFVVPDDNDPLHNPVVVVHVRDDGVLLLLDGRKVIPVSDLTPGELREAIRRAGHRVDLADVNPAGDGANTARIFVSERAQGRGPGS